MNQTPEHDQLATALAGLQQQLKGAAGSVLHSPPGKTTSLRHPTLLDQALTLSENHDRKHQVPLLIGASKTQPVALLEEAIELGLREFGENKVQEAQAKWPELKARNPEVRLHLIGPLQSNKAADAVALFDVIQTVDRMKIADALAAEMTRQQKFPKLLIQVNTGEEPQKAGGFPRDVAALVAHCRELNLPVIGLMCVPPADENPAPHFALMKKMASELSLPELSMGMSDDFPVAVRLGATMVRVGTALFGRRG